VKNKTLLKQHIKKFKDAGIRTSIFVNADTELVKHAADTGTDRIELYTEPYALGYPLNKVEALEPFLKAAIAAGEVGLGLNAGHDLNLDNLKYFVENMPKLLEVSIGHALISDALYLGLENTIQMYLKRVKG
jgi:pyridoxine 5-phosphate synthase